MIISEEKKITLKIELCAEDEKNIKKTFHLLNTIDDVIQQYDDLKDITDFINEYYDDFLTFLNDLEIDTDNVTNNLEKYLNEE
jgi:hypothetical protein